MPCLIVGNTRTDEMVGDLATMSPFERELGAISALRLLWYAQAGDVVVLPVLPQPEFLAYLTAQTGVDPDSLVLLAPPPGELGTGLLSPDRTADPGFRERLLTAVRQQSVTDVLVVYKDLPIVQLIESVGLRLPGHAFSAQGGDAILNSKAGFRAVAAGSGAPIAPGLTTTRPAEAIELVTRLLAAGDSVIVKQEFCCNGFGNEILSPTDGVRMTGALTVVVLSDPAAVANYFAQRWDWLTLGGRHQAVIEQYFTDCDTVYGEYLIDEDGPHLLGVGELRMAPVPVSDIVPAPALPADARTVLVDAGIRMGRAVHGIGYRGSFSTDAVLTPSGEIFLTETNARMSGSTYLYVVMRDRVLDPAHRSSRVIWNAYDWVVPSFAEAVHKLAETGLAFARDTGTGVILTTDQLPEGTVGCCVFAENMQQAEAIQRQLTTLFGTAPITGYPMPDDRTEELQAHGA